MMSSSAEEDSFLFLLGGFGLGKEETVGFPLSSLSDPEEESKEPVLAKLNPPPLDLFSLSLWDLDLLFLR